ncbi:MULTISPECIES: Kiwa anti-phage protein KwaB-like domain-containing protein [Aeromonas]|uniref:Kiwa anti-phage protein KwaB-like domain-containing protein n=1 Tax=Aeromonas TaxID=642 RepID=UPI001CEFCB11|nr:Kiwa anti-phage protein KwaB-like domain-containing protein [Aeromonas hydrophila]MCK0187092.1 DUF4868 domain-containing protein [Aeromonas hydrophila]UCM57540.1 DUF4868 domain-containing protein [Aeromonas hydrophila]UOV92000.1 DUF4868 domain-containing protein [Aeromonas hydrophila]
MELFAITDVGFPNIVRIETDKKTQIHFSKLFVSQEVEFKSLYDIPVEFSGGYITDPDEYFYITDFDDVIGVLDAINNPTKVPAWDPELVSVNNIKALFSGHNGNPAQALLQAFDRRQIIDNNKTLFQHLVKDHKEFSMSTNIGISIDSKITAILKGNELRFKSFHSLRRIFDMDGYFKEATNEDLQNFADHKCFEMEPGFDLTDPKISDSVIRKKVSLINKSRVLEEHGINDLELAASEIGFDLKVVERNGVKKIKMPTVRKDIKRLLCFLDEDYFTSHITQTLFRANSKKKVNR